MADHWLDDVERFFAAVAANDAQGAGMFMHDDVVVDITNSTAPWRGISTGKSEVSAAIEEFARGWDDLGGVTWEFGRSRRMGRWAAVETFLRGQGPATGLRLDATGGWLVGSRGELIAEAKLFQSYDETLLEARRCALADARLYFVCDARPHGQDPSALLEAAIRGGADMIQLREKAPRCAEELAAFAEPFARAARERGVLFWLNDEPSLVERCAADGVHVGQDDVSVAEARSQAGPSALVGLSTHSPEDFDAAIAAGGAARPDQISVGPVWETPTKEGRPGTGLGVIEHAAASGTDAAWFAIGGIDTANVGNVVAAGARRIVVVRALRDARDPEAAARELRAAIAL